MALLGVVRLYPLLGGYIFISTAPPPPKRLERALRNASVAKALPVSKANTKTRAWMGKGHLWIVVYIDAEQLTKRRVIIVAI